MAALARWLVRLYPPALRRTHGHDIAAAMRADWDRLPSAGARLRLATAFVADVAHCWRRATGDIRPATLTRGWMSDVRNSVRVLRRTPGHIAATVLCLGVGIAASTSVFSLVNALLYRDLDGIVGRGSLARARLVTGRAGDLPLAPSTTDVRALERLSYQTIEGLASEGEINVAATVAGEPGTATAAFVSGRYFDLLGSRAERGRLLTVEDDRPDAAPVVVVSDRFWRQSLGQRNEAVGQSITIAGRPVTVVGVAPAGFSGVELSEFGAPAGSRLQFWLPLSAATGWPGAPSVEASWHAVVVRLAASGTQQSAAVELSAAAAGLTGDGNRGLVRVVTSPLSAGPGDLPTDVAIMIGLFLALPLAVLAIGCANVANLQLARGTDRARELAVRMSIGASRFSAMRLLVTETIVLAALTGVIGVAATSVALELLKAFVPLPLGIDWRVLLFSLGLVAIVIVVAGVVPSWIVTRQPLAIAYREAAPSAGPRHTCLRRALVTLQAALSLVLLAISALFGRSLQNISVATPATISEIVVGRVDVGTAGYDGAGARRFLSAVTDRLAAEPDVAGVAAQSLRAIQYRRTDATGTIAAPELTVLARYVTPAWFDVMGARARRGRVLRADDDTTMAVINDRLLAGAANSPGVGDVLAIRESAGAPPRMVSIVGVIPNERRPAEPHDDPGIYLLMPAALPTSLTVLVRTRHPETGIGRVRRAAAAVDDRVAFTDVATAETLLARDLSPVRYVATTVGALGFIALVLSATGLYAVMSYVVSLRRYEIGIRMAVGAEPRDVMWLILGESARLALSGVVVGLVLAVPATYVVRFLFVGLSVLDPVALGGAAVVLIGSALVAAVRPARRAAQVDPIQTLRENA
jgi:predicted permease